MNDDESEIRDGNEVGESRCKAYNDPEATRAAGRCAA
jgi:hypothetical protein